MKIETKFDHDLGLRHKPGMTSNDFIKRYCEVFRKHAYATQDDSLNEFEKLITHVLDMLCYHQRRSELLGLDTDPRGDIERIEDAVNDLIAAEDVMREALTVNPKPFEVGQFRRTAHPHTLQEE